MNELPKTVKLVTQAEADRWNAKPILERILATQNNPDYYNGRPYVQQPSEINSFYISELIKSLYLNKPFYGYTLSRLDRKISTSVPTAAVNCQKLLIEINNYFLATLSRPMQLFVLEHEVLHEGLHHFSRFRPILQEADGKVDPQKHSDFNIGADNAINQLINVQEGDWITFKSFKEMLKDRGYPNVKVDEKMQAEYYYKILREHPAKNPCSSCKHNQQGQQQQQQKPGGQQPQPSQQGQNGQQPGQQPGQGQQPSQQGQPGQGGQQPGQGQGQNGQQQGQGNGQVSCPAACGKCGSGLEKIMNDLYGHNKQISNAAQDNSVFREILKKAKKRQEDHERKKGIGQGDGLSSILPDYEGKVHSKIWEKLITHAFGDDIKAEVNYYFGRPSRRFEDSFHYKKHVIEGRKVYIVVDTSGSVGDDELTKFMGYVRKGMRSTGTQVTLIECDDGVHEKSIRKFKRLPKDVGIKMHGRGGTDLTKALDYIENNLEKNSKGQKLREVRAIFLTDGYTPWRKPKIKVSVVYTAGSHSEISPVYNHAKIDGVGV